MIRILFFSLIISFNTFSQESDDKFFIHPVIKFGTMFSGLSSYEFSASYWYEDDYWPVYPNIFIGAGIETKDINIGLDASLNFILELSYGKAKTSKVSLTGSNADFQVTSIPLIFWIKLKSPGKLSPFVKLGAGVEKINYSETYYNKQQFGYEIEQSFFSYGIGAGIDLNLFSNITISLFVDALNKENGFVVDISEPEIISIDYDTRNSTINCGLAFAYLF